MTGKTDDDQIKGAAILGQVAQTNRQISNQAAGGGADQVNDIVVQGQCPAQDAVPHVAGVPVVQEKNTHRHAWSAQSGTE